MTLCCRYEKVFQKDGVKLWWQNVKGVKGNKGVTTLVDQIGRAKADLVLAHQNASRQVWLLFPFRSLFSFASNSPPTPPPNKRAGKRGLGRGVE